MAGALALFQQVAQAFPEDPAVSRRIATLSDSLQPAELLNPKARTTDPLQSASAVTPEQEGERLFALGDHAGAMAAYRQALRERPDNALIRERLEELFRLAQSSPPNTQAQGSPAAPADSAPAPASGDAPLPADPAARLSALLGRIAARRRG